MPSAFVRQLCWRDFYHQVLAAFPKLATVAYRPGADDDWATDDEALGAWKAGETGVEVVDAGMRRLLDADVADNSGNWQWTAGTGNDSKPYRRFNPVRQQARFDPDREYVRRWLG